MRAAGFKDRLLLNLSAHIGMHICYGNRTIQTQRVRAFLDLTIARLLDSPDYVLSAKELETANKATLRYIAIKCWQPSMRAVYARFGCRKLTADLASPKVRCQPLAVFGHLTPA